MSCKRISSFLHIVQRFPFFSNLKKRPLLVCVFEPKFPKFRHKNPFFSYFKIVTSQFSKFLKINLTCTLSVQSFSKIGEPFFLIHSSFIHHSFIIHSFIPINFASVQVTLPRRLTLQVSRIVPYLDD